MSIRFIGLILIVLVLAVSLSGCAEDSRSKRPRSTTFSDQQESSGRPEKESRDSSDSRAATGASEPNKNPDDALAQPHDHTSENPARGTLPPADENTAEETMRREAEEAAPLAVREEVRSSMPAYKIPEKLRTRLQEERPDLVPAHSTNFEVFNQHLNISTKTSTMTFTGVLRRPGKQDEEIELTCRFDKGKDPWECDQMYPVDPTVAKERRMQATVTCWDTHRCDQVAVEFFVVIDGKTESQLFQKQTFSARIATSGDASDDEDELDDYGVQRLEKPVSLPNRPDSQQPRVLEKPTPSETPIPSPPAREEPKTSSPGPSQPVLTSSARPPRKPERSARPPERDLDEKEIEEAMDDPNVAIDMTSPLPVPRPARGQYSIPGVESLRTQMGNNVKVQAVGRHTGGVLRSGTELNSSGTGYVRLNREDRHFGTDLTIGLLKSALASVSQTFPNRPPFLISNISQKIGGKLGRHASHQTGLDVDVAFPSSREVTQLWSICGGKGCSSSLSDKFDLDRFWHFTKSLTCAQKNPVIAMFIDSRIKKHICRWARTKGENLESESSCAHKTLKAMKHEDGHKDHVHIRFKCPGNRECREATVSLGRGTGC